MGRMNWQNATATLLTGLIVGVYAAFLKGTSGWLISAARGTIAVVLVLGVSAWALYTLDPETRSRAERDFGGVATAIESVALLAAVIGLITGSTIALAVLVAGMLALWLIAILRRATIRPKPVSRSAGDGASYLPGKASGQVKGEVLNRHHSAVVEVPQGALPARQTKLEQTERPAE